MPSSMPFVLGHTIVNIAMCFTWRVIDIVQFEESEILPPFGSLWLAVSGCPVATIADATLSVITMMFLLAPVSPALLASRGRSERCFGGIF